MKYVGFFLTEVEPSRLNSEFKYVYVCITWKKKDT